MYDREFKLIVPEKYAKGRLKIVTPTSTIKKIEKTMASHFGGVSIYPRIKGFWYDKTSKKMVEDDNILFSSVKEYSKSKHPMTEHMKDERFMEKLAKEVGRKTKQKAMLVEEDLVGKCSIIPIKQLHERRHLERVI